MNDLEIRMYGLVNYQLSGIQKGIQFGHAVVDYGINYPTEEYSNWANNHKTFIILNGGTTNDNANSLGTMNLHLETLRSKNITVQEFREPDLGDQITAICFLVDERVFDKKKYPDCDHLFYDINDRKKWVREIGGSKNLFLREFLKDFKLA